MELRETTMNKHAKPYTIGWIFARGGSKGVPRKNIRMLDDDEIARIAQEFGAEVPFMRPAELAQDHSPEWLAWRHAVQEISKDSESRPMEVFIALPPTSPLRSVEDVDCCIQCLIQSAADMIITVKAAVRHPSFNMIKLDKNGYAHVVMPLDSAITRRQDAPVIYDMTTVAYATRPAFILNANSLFEGNIKAIVIPEERAVDIDTELDFAFAEFLLTRKHSI
jgi:N-acylneuraminate cytidylyltransferase